MKTVEAAKNWLRTMTVWRAVLLALLALSLYATVVRFAGGLGAATNLSDAFPWGLWIGFDVLVGVGLAAGGFVIAATVHVFHMEKYESIARPTVLTAFLGYLLVCVALLFDLGRPYRIWHPLVMWNPHSVMFEVAWCVVLYTTVLALEFSPLVFERLNLQKPLRIMRAIYVPLVIVGVLLSTLHQSSLGTLYVIAPDKLHGLWYSPLLPVFFFITAVAGGLAMTVFESFMSWRAFGKRLEAHLLQGLARVMVVVLAVYAIWKLQDLAYRGNLGLVFTLTPESVLFWGEMGLGALLPVALLIVPAIRKSDNGLFFASMLVIMGFIVNRLNVAITGMAASSGVNYIPSWMEFVITATIVAVGFVLFGMAVKYLPVFPKEELPGMAGEEHALVHPPRTPVFHRGVLAGLWILLALGAAAVGFSMARVNGRAHAATPPTEAAVPASSASRDLRLPASFTFPAGEESPGPVVFNHESHVDPAEPRCQSCHGGLFRINAAGQPLEGELSYERIHEGDLCHSCHDGKSAFAVDDDCSTCHGS
jgi:c(7)-type cytochrome triheme protein